MSEVKSIIGKNLSELRKKRGLTQAELATKLNYTDKAISKWEHGDALPSIDNLLVICEFYGITLDQLVKENAEKIKVNDEETENKVNKIVISLLSFFTIWTIATIIYVSIYILKSTYFWLIFIWAITPSIVVLIIFNSIWGFRKLNFALVTTLIWSIITTAYITLLTMGYNMWVIFLVGIPATIIVILWSRIKFHKKTN